WRWGPWGGGGSVESGIGGFFGGSTTVCRCSLRAASFGCGCRLLGSFGVFCGGTTGVASGNSPADTPRPLGSFWDSTHRKKVSFSSSIAAHPERLKLADTAIEASATRAQGRIEALVIGPPSVGGARGCHGYGFRAVNSPLAALVPP